MIDVPSPCRGICEMDKITGWCIGCGRTELEIKDWKHIDGKARMALVRKDLKERLKQLGRWPMLPATTTGAR